MTTRKQPDDLIITINPADILKAQERAEVLLRQLEKQGDTNAAKMDSMLLEVRTAGNLISVHSEQIMQINRQITELNRTAAENRAYIDGNRSLADRVKTHGDQIDALRIQQTRWDVISSIVVFIAAAAFELVLRLVFHV